MKENSNKLLKIVMILSMIGFITKREHHRLDLDGTMEMLNNGFHPTYYEKLEFQKKL